MARAHALLLGATCALVAACGGEIAPDDAPPTVSVSTPRGETADPAPSDASPTTDGGPLDAPSPDDAPAPDAPIVDNPFHAGDDWVGTYTCPQGLTNLDLHIVGVDGDAVTATFDFDWTGTKGSFALSGTWQPVGARMRFDAGAWIDRPSSSWWTVNMDGTVDVASATYAGVIDTTGCGAFTVTRR